MRAPHRRVSASRPVFPLGAAGPGAPLGGAAGADGARVGPRALEVLRSVPTPAAAPEPSAGAEWSLADVPV